MGFSLENPAATALLKPYLGGEGTRRYYQDAAIRTVLEKIIQSELNNTPQRALLSLATGAGKTFIAVNLLKRIADAGHMKCALFLCDRDELRTQALKAFQAVFGSDAAEVYKKSDATNNAQNARVHVATYQTLGIDSEHGDASLLKTFYPENSFTHIIIDECHRSAWGKWSEALTRNRDAVQIGLTATPRKIKISEKNKEALADADITAHNITYFGEPVYEYDLAQGIEDGYLAACEIVKGRVSIDKLGLTKDEVINHNPTNVITGKPIVDENEIKERYDKQHYERPICLPDRVEIMCRDLFNYLLNTGGPEQKTIIFCVRDFHADAVANEMNNRYAA